jgi:serine/threonine-protein phosphatase 6 regulatory ankyrin repeat subunit B
MLDDFYDLVKNGADFNMCDEDGNTHLINASKKDDIELVKFLITQTQRIDQENKFGNTALYYATINNNIQIVEALFNAGAKITDGIYMLAIHNNSKQITKFFDMQDSNKRFMLSL